MNLTFASGVRFVQHKPITLRNAATLKEYAERCIAKAKAGNEAEMGRTFLQITKQYPELLRLIDMQGQWNVESISYRLEQRRVQHQRACEETGEVVPFNEEEYRERITKEMQAELQAIIKETPLLAKLVQFTSPAFGEDMDSLLLGIETIKAVATEQSLEGLTDDDWLDVSASEVAAWINNFCSKVA